MRYRNISPLSIILIKLLNKLNKHDVLQINPSQTLSEMLIVVVPLLYLSSWSKYKSHVQFHRLVLHNHEVNETTRRPRRHRA